MIYAVAVGLLLYYIAYRIAVSRKHLLMQKELELYRQKQEFKKESELKDQKIDSLKEENLQAELSHKSEELIRTTLNIVRKNEMLMGIKKEVLGISHSISEENLVSSGVKHFGYWDRLKRILSTMTTCRLSKAPLTLCTTTSSENSKRHIPN